MDRIEYFHRALDRHLLGAFFRLSMLVVVAFGWASLGTAAPQAMVSEEKAMDRLSILAAKLGDADENPVPFVTEAVRLCGFSITDEDGKPIAEPLLQTRILLSVTASEIKYYSRLLRTGNNVQLGDFTSGLEVLFAAAGGEGKLYPHVEDWLDTATVSANPSLRCLKQFLWMLSGNHDGPSDIPFKTSSKLDPLQVLLLTRVITEDIGVPLRKHLKTLKGPVLLASTQPSAPEDVQLPGWAEDGYIGIITNVVGAIAENVEKLNNYGKAVEKANAISSIAKFIATYAFLEVTLGVEEPGQPLVRTKNTDSGSQRTITAKFTINGTAVTDWLKENRKLVAVSGLDIDMPKTGALSGVEANFEIDQDRYSSKSHLIQTVGRVNISKIVSDADGVARMKIEGTPQRYKLDPNKILPVEKTVKISVTPQVKSTEIKQDMVDAVLGAVGIKSGPIGLITPVIECLYRMKWAGTKWMKLKVKDWTESVSYASVTFEIHASGNTPGNFRKGINSDATHINQVLNITDMTMVNVMGDRKEMPAMPKEMLAALPPAQRKEFEEAMAAMKALSATLLFQATGPGDVSLSINNTTLTEGIDDGCVEEMFAYRFSQIGNRTWEFPKGETPDSPFNLAIQIDKETNKVTIAASAGTAGRNITESVVNGKRKSKSEETILLFGTGINLKVSEILIQAKKSPESDNERIDWYGATRVPFTFGPKDKYSGVMIVSFSLTQRIKNPPKAKR